jgi:uncharacterized damage-inducible protein DinB
MSRDELAHLIQAHDAVWNHWWPALRALSDADAHREFVSSYPSVFATTRHMVGAEAYWQHRLDAEPLDTAGDAALTVQSLEAAWRILQARRATWAAAADPHAHVSGDAVGAWVTVEAWQCVTHVIAHAHLHRGQLVTFFRQLGRRPPSIDLLNTLSGDH